ncbi:tRNA intron endonuclease catalytic domain-like protein [Botryosphaeria dothidea]|uniref:tRNA-intron lyase n=1 Tax=Botryosphaeria dothidea TaxID=55169 RepID=A0A8H4N4S8_9PEZI|nr:tRNA intron endonuclease catalytic domain-like protein [Botryosphaeria dothidea]
MIFTQHSTPPHASATESFDANTFAAQITIRPSEKMSGLGLDHVFPFPRDDAISSASEPVETPERSETPQVVIHSSDDVPVQRPLPEKAQPEERSPSPLAHVFPWQRSPTPPFEQMQVFEPFDIGDMTPTPSEWSEGQYSSAQQSPDRRRKEVGLVPERVPTPRTVPEMAPQLKSLAQPEPIPVPKVVSDVSLDEEVFPTPVAEEKFVSVEPAASGLDSTTAEEVPKEEPASQVLENVEDTQAQIQIDNPASVSEILPAVAEQSASQPANGEPQDQTESASFDGPSEVSAPPPIPISRVGDRYMLYDTDVIAYLRREHNICGVLIGTLPSHPQQNVFLGTPLQLMPEEARRLVEIGAAYIVDDVEAHKTGIMGLGEAERKAYLRAMEKQGIDAQRANQKKADDIKKEALKKNAEKIERARKAKQEKQQQQRQESSSAATQDQTQGDDALFAPATPPRPSSPAPSQAPSSTTTAEDRFYITPSTSHPPLPTPPTSPPERKELPTVPRSYPLFAYLHSRGYFMSPGLRFGCQYCVYPGDPLRFHSHFLAVGKGWDEEFDLMQLVGGGRLGTGVKKGFLVGGKEKRFGKVDEDEGGSEKGVRAFSIEWSGM